MELPDKYDFKEAEKKWIRYWKDNHIYRFDKRVKKPVFSIDTPPPTVSGRMHLGHAFSYSQGDFIARFFRMKGNNVFYPWGTDDNGMPTDKLVEKTKNVKSIKMSRQEYIDLCMETINELKPAFNQDWINLGMSCEFDDSYSTIDRHSIKTSQKSFIDLYKKGLVYRKETPISWDTHFQSAVAQADFESIEMKSFFNEIIFKCGEKELVVATTRPELIPACVALFAHTDDSRYTNLKKKFAKVPLFNYEVPVLFDETVEMDKGTGLMMVCTFGDKDDIAKWHKYNLPLRAVIEKNGKMNERAERYNGLSITEARKEIIQDLKNSGALISQKEIVHPVNVYERSGIEIEYLNTVQWFVRVLENKQKLLDAGEKIKWYPKHMKARYVHWVENLNWDWCISRQRHFGVPFPVWYDKEGNVILADESQLPVNPFVDKPKGYENTELIPEADVMDTWATSSVTPQIALDWADDEKEFMKKYPMSLRLQAHDIIRTWAFYTIIKGLYNNHDIPWKDIVISGHVLMGREKMSKSRGNSVDPRQIMEKFGADALRFWAAGSRLGDDLPYMEKDIVTGQKMVTKLFNSSRFAVSNLKEFNYNLEKPSKIWVSDAWILSKLNRLIKDCAESFGNYEFSRTKMDVEKFFYQIFCDNYLEIIKDRMYNKERYDSEYGKDAHLSCLYTVYTVTLDILKMMAPIMPFIAEEIYQMYFAKKDGQKSIHLSVWPECYKNLINADVEKKGDALVDILSSVRRFKSEKNLSLKTDIKKLTIGLNHENGEEMKSIIESVIPDLKASTRALKIEFADFIKEKEGEIKTEKFQFALDIMI